MKLVRALSGEVGYTLVASMERKNPSYLQRIANPPLSQSTFYSILRRVTKLRRERVREEAARREGADAPLEIDATHRHGGLRSPVKGPTGRTENQVLRFNWQSKLKKSRGEIHPSISRPQSAKRTSQIRLWDIVGMELPEADSFTVLT